MIRLFLAVYLVLLIQTTLLIKFISIFGFEPDLIVILLTFYSLNLTPSRAMTLGFFTGLVIDTFNPTQMGINMLIYTIYAYVFGSFKDKINLQNPQSQFFAISTGCLSSRLLYFTLTEYTNPSRIFSEFFLSYLPDSIYTGLVGLLLFFLLPSLRKAMSKVLDKKVAD